MELKRQKAMEFKSIKERKTDQDIKLDSIKKCEALMIWCGSTMTGHELTASTKQILVIPQKKKLIYICLNTLICLYLRD